MAGFQPQNMLPIQGCRLATLSLPRRPCRCALRVEGVQTHQMGMWYLLGWGWKGTIKQIALSFHMAWIIDQSQ